MYSAMQGLMHASIHNSVMVSFIVAVSCMDNCTGLVKKNSASYTEKKTWW